MTRSTLQCAGPVLAAAVLASGCGAAGAPESAAEPAPVPAADFLCSRPGFAREVGQARYRLVDMDQGQTCEVFVEQDECVLAIFRDCTDLARTKREWQGIATMEETVRIAPLYPSEAEPPLRTPICCEGPTPVDEPPKWLLLDCRFTSCITANRGHTGLYLVPSAPDRPALSVASTEQVATLSSGGADVRAAWDGVRDEAWMGWARGGLYVRPRTGSAAQVPDVAGVSHLAQDETTLFAADGSTVRRIDKATRIASPAKVLDRSVLAMERIAEGLLVGLQDGVSTRLLLLDPVSLESTAEVTRPGTITGLATRPLGGVALATFDRSPQLSVLDATLSTVREIEMGDLRDLGVDGVVPYGPRMIAADRVAFYARCYRGAPSRHCYFEHKLDADPDNPADRSIRIGVPNETRIVDVVTNVLDAVWLAGEDRRIHRLATEPVRPDPGALTTLDHEVGALLAPENELWAVSPDGRLSILTGTN